jgi:L-lactate dehydrogenase complex protein LldG
MSDRATFLKRVREALRYAAPKRHLHGHGVVEEDRADGPESFREWLPPVGKSWAERFELFRANAVALKAEVVLYRDATDLAARLQQRARAEGWKKIAQHRGAWTQPVLEQLPGEKIFTDAGYDRAALELSDVGITECDSLVAQTGSVLVTSRSAGGRVLSVLPPHHIVLARHDQLVPDLTAALAGARETYRNGWPSMMSFITGPSRTADIERILVLGAHGPKRLTIFCDQPPPP